MQSTPTPHPHPEAHAQNEGSERGVKYNSVNLKWWVQPPINCKHFGNFFLFMKCILRLSTFYLFKITLSDWSHNFWYIAKAMDLTCTLFIQVNNTVILQS